MPEAAGRAGSWLSRAARWCHACQPPAQCAQCAQCAGAVLQPGQETGVLRHRNDCQVLHGVAGDGSRSGAKGSNLAKPHTSAQVLDEPAVFPLQDTGWAPRVSGSWHILQAAQDTELQSPGHTGSRAQTATSHRLAGGACLGLLTLTCPWCPRQWLFQRHTCLGSREGPGLHSAGCSVRFPQHMRLRKG